MQIVDSIALMPLTRHRKQGYTQTAAERFAGINPTPLPRLFVRGGEPRSALTGLTTDVASPRLFTFPRFQMSFL